MPFSPISEILEDLRAGRMIVLTDDEHRENEGDLVLPAEFVTPEAITFMLREAKGYLCLSMTEADCDRLDLHAQSAVNTTVRGTAFTVSVDLHPRHGGTTGVSARERARCIRMMADPATGPADFVRPGHINPLRSRDGGVLVRTGQTEGSLDLCRLAGLQPAAAIIEIMRDDGEMARVPDLERFCAAHGLKMCSVAQIIQHRLARERLVRRMEPASGTPLRTALGEFNLVAFESVVDPLPHIALTVGGVGSLGADGRPVERAEPTLVRMHRRNLLGDLFLDLASGATGAGGSMLHESMRMIQRAGAGAVVYLRPEGDGPALAERLNAIRRSSGPVRGGDDPELSRGDSALAAAVPRDMRQFGIGGQILRELGLSRLRLITRHATELPGLDAFGLSIVERVSPGA
ncbi:MAG: 3,4-dihydroxy-2-butanone-4-phosphate synthase [Phycisphaerae bacterium]|nr:3,4-dihydroxy-2-butanone-4-phosphate synthase [Phycisphaerae bacterium]